MQYCVSGMLLCPYAPFTISSTTTFGKKNWPKLPIPQVERTSATQFLVIFPVCLLNSPPACDTRQGRQYKWTAGFARLETHTTACKWGIGKHNLDLLSFFVISIDDTTIFGGCQESYTKPLPNTTSSQWSLLRDFALRARFLKKLPPRNVLELVEVSLSECWFTMMANCSALSEKKRDRFFIA